MNHRHFKKILISNNIVPKTLSETKTALKLVQQKEKFILEDASKALVHNKKIQALNSISFGTLELVFLNASRYMSVFESGIKKEKILTKDNKPKYNNKREIKSIFSIIRNARNDICHHRRIGASIRSNQKYTKHKMTLSDVTRALEDLKTLLNYDDRFDVQGIELKYKDFNKGK